MITLLLPKRMPVATGVCLRFTARVRGREFDRQAGKNNRDSLPIPHHPKLVCEQDSGAYRDGEMKQKNKEGVRGAERRSVRHARIITRPHALCLHAAEVIPSAQANPNDLVGSEMCHKGALMDEREHAANDAAASTRLLSSHLMKAPTPQTGTYNGVRHREAPRLPGRTADVRTLNIKAA